MMQAAKGGKCLNGSQMQDLQTMALSAWQEVLKAAVKVERPCRFCDFLSLWGCQFPKRLLNFVSFWSLTGVLCFLQERRLQSRENKYTTKGGILELNSYFFSQDQIILSPWSIWDFWQSSVNASLYNSGNCRGPSWLRCATLSFALIILMSVPGLISAFIFVNLDLGVALGNMVLKCYFPFFVAIYLVILALLCSFVHFVLLLNFFPYQDCNR